jgi:5-methylthioadenosine/S-adenosylhomocysteine deaminase
MREADLLFRGGTAVTLDGNRRVISGAALVVRGDTIVAVGPEAETAALWRVRRTIDCDGKYLFPGFVSTHTHLFQTLLKGIGRDKPLFEWLSSSVLRVLHRYDREAVRYAALTGLIEALRTGTTTVLDFQYCRPVPGLDEAVIEAFEGIGLRGVLASAHVSHTLFADDRADRYGESEEEYFLHLRDLCGELSGNPLLSPAIAVPIIWTHGREGYARIREAAEELGLPVTMHVGETADDDAYALKSWGKRALPFLDECGLLHPGFIAVHGVVFNEDDIALAARRGIALSHCPVANMILASGAAPVPRMAAAGITVSLGVDGAASNDSQDMLETLKTASLLHKLVSRDPAVMPAGEVLDMACRGGAAALGMSGSIGSLETGKKADFFVYNPLNCRSVPVHDPTAALVYSSGQANIETVVVHGRPVLDRGVVCGVDEEQVLARTQEIARRLVR